jgi:ribosome biogenesis GTPase A
MKIMNIVWYPGHMVKTKRQIQESIKMIDVVIELIDARIPESSRNPDLDSLINDRPKVVLLNKCDLAEDAATKKWINYYKLKGVNSLDIDCMTGKNLNKIYATAREAVKEKMERKIAKGIIGRPVRAMIVGIPNVGKSSFINRIASRQIAKTGDKPGVTRTKQWINVSSDFELLDTPGILWPKFDDEKVALHLAYTRAIKDDILDTEELAVKFIEEIAAIRPEVLIKRYNIEIKADAEENLLDIGKRRGCMISGGEIDTLRTANIILDDYRSGKLGKITFEIPGLTL